MAATDSRCCVRTRVQEIEQETAPATGQEIVRVIVPEIVVVTVRAHVTGPVAAIALKQRTVPRAVVVIVPKVVAVTAPRVVAVIARRPPTVAAVEVTVVVP